MHGRHWWRCIDGIDDECMDGIDDGAWTALMRCAWTALMMCAWTALMTVYRRHWWGAWTTLMTVHRQHWWGVHGRHWWRCIDGIDDGVHGMCMALTTQWFCDLVYAPAFRTSIYSISYMHQPFIPPSVLIHICTCLSYLPLFYFIYALAFRTSLCSKSQWQFLHALAFCTSPYSNSYMHRDVHTASSV